MRRLLSLSLYSLLVVSLSSQALPEDWEQEAIILADGAEFDRKNDTVIYTGDVVLTQGTLRIESERLVVHGSNEQIEKAIATGQPARYQQQVQADEPLTHAEALTIEFYAQERQAVLIGQAQLRQEGNLMTGEKIHYDMTKEIVTAGHNNDQPTRIKVILQPQPKDKQETN